MSTQYISNKFLNWLLKGEILDQMTNLSLGLLTVMPDLSGLNYEEPSAADYERASLAPEDFETSTEGSISNIRDIYFVGTTIGWGIVIGLALFDNLGQLLWVGNLIEPLEILEFKRPQIEIGDIRFTVGECPPIEDGYYEGGFMTSIPDGYFKDGILKELVPSFAQRGGGQVGYMAEIRKIITVDPKMAKGSSTLTPTGFSLL